MDACSRCRITTDTRTREVDGIDGYHHRSIPADTRTRHDGYVAGCHRHGPATQTRTRLDTLRQSIATTRMATGAYPAFVVDIAGLGRRGSRTHAHRRRYGISACLYTHWSRTRTHRRLDVYRLSSISVDMSTQAYPRLDAAIVHRRIRRRAADARVSIIIRIEIVAISWIRTKARTRPHMDVIRWRIQRIDANIHRRDLICRRRPPRSALLTATRSCHKGATAGAERLRRRNGC